MAGSGVNQDPVWVAESLRRALSDWARLSQDLRDPDLQARVASAGVAIVAALSTGHKLLVLGNGGSAAMASHVAAEFAGKCILDRKPLPAISLAESTTSITAIGNDYGFDQVFSRGIEALGQPDDVVIAMSTSARSPNVLNALEVAGERGMHTILLTGARGASTSARVSHLLPAPSISTPRIQEVHLLWTHSWCEAVDRLWSQN